MKADRLVATGLAVLTAVAPAYAAEAPERELQMLGRCALATSVYKSLMPPAAAPVQITDADRGLYARIQLADPALRARAEDLARSVEAGRRDAIAIELKAQFQAQLAPPGAPRRTPREALDLYAPLLESCIIRAQLLPKD